MRNEVLNLGFSAEETERTAHTERIGPDTIAGRQRGSWNPQNFEREQIRGLVRQVFFSDPVQPVRQIVMSAIDPDTNVRSICRKVGEALILETTGSVAVIGAYPQIFRKAESDNAGETSRENLEDLEDQTSPLRRQAIRVRGNLWLVGAPDIDGHRNSTASLQSYLGAVRTEFEYSILESPPAGESDLATAMAQFADGVILVLSANRTRRFRARRIQQILENAKARLLGTVLNDRQFPIPESIYRRL
jgi:hypothetical protein